MAQSKVSFKEQMKGFPTWQMLVICVIRFSEPIAFSSIFPYIYFMIRDFGVAKDKDNIATYSGYLAASFAIAQFLFCVKWGQASDRYGRKLILILGLFGTSISVLLFGFASNYYFALAARCCMGASNGNIAVLRTVIGEIATERGHQAIAFSTLPLLWNVGFVIGPMIGASSYLTRPRKAPEDDLLAVLNTSESLHERFITKYPYALSNIVVALFLWLSMIVAFLFLEETHYKFRKTRDIGLEIGDFIRRALGFKVEPRPWKKPASHAKVVPTESTPLIRTDSSESISSELSNADTPQEGNSTESVEDVFDDDDSIESFGPISRQVSQAIIRRYSTKETRPTLSRSTTRDTTASILTEYKNAEIFTPAVVQTIAANFFTSLHAIVYSEFLPVILAGNLLLDELEFPFKIKGGFGIDLSSIGTLLSTTGLIGSLSIVFLFPFLDRNFKSITTYRAASVIYPLPYLILPYLIFTLSDYNPNFPPWFTKFALYLLASITALCNALAFPNLTMLLHRASNPRHRSYINGSALSLSSLARFIGPVVWGYLMSESQKLGAAEISWMLLALIAIVCSIQSFMMKEHDEDMKVSPEETIEEVTIEA